MSIAIIEEIERGVYMFYSDRNMNDITTEAAAGHVLDAVDQLSDLCDDSERANIKLHIVRAIIPHIKRTVASTMQEYIAAIKANCLEIVAGIDFVVLVT